jgi:hypothetical protein
MTARGTGRGRPGAASASTDDESGNDGADAKHDAQRSLRALKVLRDRGIIDPAEYERRRGAIEGGSENP